MRPVHKCAAEGCDITVSTSILMCPRHWKQVPRAIQARVWKAWDAYKALKGADLVAARPVIAELRAAQAAAAASVGPASPSSGSEKTAPDRQHGLFDGEAGDDSIRRERY